MAKTNRAENEPKDAVINMGAVFAAPDMTGGGNDKESETFGVG